LGRVVASQAGLLWVRSVGRLIAPTRVAVVVEKPPHPAAPHTIVKCTMRHPASGGLLLLGRWANARGARNILHQEPRWASFACPKIVTGRQETTGGGLCAEFHRLIEELAKNRWLFGPEWAIAKRPGLSKKNFRECPQIRPGKRYLDQDSPCLVPGG